jgi:hypothetical protein
MKRATGERVRDGAGSDHATNNAARAARKAGVHMADLQHTWSDSYASFDVSEWVETDTHEPDTVVGCGEEETLELTAMPDVFADGLHTAADLS